MNEAPPPPLKKFAAGRFLVRAGSAMLCGSLLFASGCKDEDPSADFERRYVLVEIPGFKTDDYAAFLDHRDPNVRYLAIANLTASGALTETSEEGDSDTGETLAKLREKIRSMLQDEAPKVRAIAAHAPSNLAEPEAVLVALLDDEVDAVRVEALAALSKFETLEDSSADAIAGQLEDDNVLVRFHALAAIGASCPISKRDELTARLAESMPKREAAEQLLILQSLGSLATKSAGEIVLGQLQSEDPRFVRAAIEMLPGLEIDGVESALLAALEKNAGPPELLLDALVRVATGESFAKAAELLSGENRDFRDRGRAILLKIGTEEARVTLLDAYHQLTPLVEAQLAQPADDAATLPEEHLAILGDIATLSRKLGRLGDDPKSMLKLLSTGGTVEKRMALHQLREQKLFDLNILAPIADDPDFMPLLLELAKTESAILRAEACNTLGHSADARVADPLMAALADPVPLVRENALNSVLKYAGNTANHDLLKELHSRRSEFVPTTWDEDDPNLEIRFSIEQAIAELESQWTSRARFRKDLEPENSSVTRLIACLLLSQDKQASEEPAPVLLDYLANGSPGEKSLAIQISATALDKTHLPRLREIAARETEETLKESLGQLIGQISD